MNSKYMYFSSYISKSGQNQNSYLMTFIIKLRNPYTRDPIQNNLIAYLNVNLSNTRDNKQV